MRKVIGAFVAVGTLAVADSAFAEYPLVFLFQWGSSGSGPQEFDRPSGIALDGTNPVIIADAGNARIQIFSTLGQFVGEWGNYGTEPGELSFPAGLAVAGQDLFIADPGLGSIHHFLTDGTFITRWSAADAGAIALGSAGKIYAAQGSSVHVYDPMGAAITTWLVDLDEVGGTAYGLALDAEDNVYVGVERPQSDGPTRFELQKFDDDGAFLQAWGGERGSAPGQFGGPIRRLVVDRYGSIYVVDTFNHRVQVFAGDGSFLTEIGGYGSGPGQFDAPEGIAIGYFGDVYVADTGNDRIQVFGFGAIGARPTTWGQLKQRY